MRCLNIFTPWAETDKYFSTGKSSFTKHVC